LTADIKTNIMTIKPVVWLADSKEQLSRFPDAARTVAGFELWEVQQGNEPSDSKPMPSVGLGVKEIRVRVGGAYRVIYLAKFAEAVYVLHAFQKKAQKTPKPDINLARTRFRELIQERKQR
jgi:phage-related protein